MWKRNSSIRPWKQADSSKETQTPNCFSRWRLVTFEPIIRLFFYLTLPFLPESYRVYKLLPDFYCVWSQVVFFTLTSEICVFSRPSKHYLNQLLTLSYRVPHYESDLTYFSAPKRTHQNVMTAVCLFAYAARPLPIKSDQSHTPTQSLKSNLTSGWRGVFRCSLWFKVCVTSDHSQLHWRVWLGVVRGVLGCTCNRTHVSVSWSTHVYRCSKMRSLNHWVQNVDFFSIL